MMKRLSIANGLLIGFLLVAVLPLIGLGQLALDAFEGALTQTVEQNIASVADRKTAQINDFVDEAIRDVRIVSVREDICHALLDLGAAFRRGGLAAADVAARKYRAELVAFHHESERFHDVLLVDAAGNVVFSIQREADLGTNLNQREHRQSALGIAYQRAMDSLTIEAGPFLPYAPSANEVAGFIVAPIFEDGVPIGAVVVQTNFSALAGVIADRVDLKTSGRVVVGQGSGRDAITLYPEAMAGGEVLADSLVATAMEQAVRGEYGSGFLGPDPNQRRVLAAWRYAPAISSGLVVAIDADEVLVPVDIARRLIHVSLGGILLLATLVATLLGRRILRAEDRLASREAQYRSIFQGIDDGVVVFQAVDEGRDFRIADLNPAAERITGRARDTVLGGELTGLFPAAERAGMVEPLRRVWRLDRDEYLPQVHYEDDRLSIWIECTFHRLRNGDVLAVIKNVSERKRAEDEVARSISLFNEAQRIANLGSWSLDLQTRKLEWSDQIFRIFGVAATAFGGTYESFLQYVHPDDREMVGQAYAASLQTRQPYDITHRLLLADGRIRYVRERCETEFAADGTPLISRGTVQDITDLREAEAEKALYARAFEHSGEAMVITDPEERILAVNRAFTRHTGYAASEVLGQTPRFLAAGRTSRRVYQEMWQSLLGCGFWQGEVWDRRKDGSIYPKWLNISAVRDVAGKISHYVGSFIDTSERKATEEKIRFLAHHDPLTGLFNRSSLDNRLDQAVLSALRDSARIAVMFIDLDRFKNINDSLGHHVGDELLRIVAQRLAACVRASDIVARLGGDEFVVVLTGLDDPLAAASIAEKIVASLNQPYPVGQRQLHTSSSLGIAVFPEDGGDPATLMKNADAAMYHAKEQGRNGYHFFSATMSADAEERLALEHELHAALGNRELVVHYQPQVVAGSGKLIGFEALVRWQHPQRGMIPPLNFIPIAEETGLIGEIGRWVLVESCRQLAAWRAEGFAKGVRMAVNLSAHQLRSPSLVDDVRQAFHDHGLGHGDLELEVTESAAMYNPEQAIERLRLLRDLGVHLAIDDFGTGYSSLAYLKLLPIHVLKLDRAFVRDIEIDDNDAAISSATISLAHSLGLQVVAEGVETQGQQDFLVARGCDFLQGYRFGKPEPAALIERRWREAALLPVA